MTRKRFIKLVMSKGYSRNSAVELARRGPAWKGGYEALYHTFFSLQGWLDHFATVILPRTIAAVCEALAAGMGAVSKAASVISKSFSETAKCYLEEAEK